MTLHAEDFAREAVALSDNFKRVSLKLVERQADFDYIDSTALLESKTDKNGWVVPGANVTRRCLSRASTFSIRRRWTGWRRSRMPVRR